MKITRWLTVLFCALAFQSQAGILPLAGNGGNTPPPTDALAALLASMSPGTWKSAGASNNNLGAIAYGTQAGDDQTLTTNIHATVGPPAIMTAWSGAALDTTHEQLLVWGGGHGDYWGNELYAFRFNTFTWTELTKPSDPTGWNFSSGIMPDGTPEPMHTYGCLAWVPTLQKMIVVGQNVPAGGGGGGWVWWIDPAATGGRTVTGIWIQKNKWPFNSGSCVNSHARYDNSTGKVWALAGEAWGTSEYTPSTDTWSIFGGSQTTDGVTNFGSALQPGVRMMLVGSGHVFFIPLDSTGTFTDVATTGDQTCQNAGNAGVDWDSDSGVLACWLGGKTVYTLNVSTLVWTTHAEAGGDNPTCSQTACTGPNGVLIEGTFDRFFFDAAHHCFGGVNTTTDNVFFLKPDF